MESVYVDITLSVCLCGSLFLFFAGYYFLFFPHSAFRGAPTLTRTWFGSQKQPPARPPVLPPPGRLLKLHCVCRQPRLQGQTVPSDTKDALVSSGLDLLRQQLHVTI